MGVRKSCMHITDLPGQYGTWYEFYLAIDKIISNDNGCYFEIPVSFSAKNSNDTDQYYTIDSDHLKARVFDEVEGLLIKPEDLYQGPADPYNVLKKVRMLQALKNGHKLK